MAKKLSYTNPTTGAISPESYWIPVQINLDILRRQGRVLFYGWHNNAARETELSYIGQKSYIVDTHAYQRFFSPEALESQYKNSICASYFFAVATLDIPLVRPTSDKDGNLIEETYYVSFFDVAEDC